MDALQGFGDLPVLALRDRSGVPLAPYRMPAPGALDDFFPEAKRLRATEGKYLGARYDVIPGLDSRIVMYDLEGLAHPTNEKPLRVGMYCLNTYGNERLNRKALAGSIAQVARSREFNIILAPEYAFLPNRRPLSQREFEGYAQLFADASDKDTLIVPGTFVWTVKGNLYNTAVLFHDGDVAYTYHKRTSGGERELARKHKLHASFGNEPGVLRNGPFGYDVGIEICADRGSLAADNVAGLDLQLFIACGLSSTDLSPLKVGGFGLCLDGRSVTHKVTRRAH